MPGDVEDDGVLGFEPEADSGADGEPPAGIFRLEEADDEVGDEHPPEEIEGGVLKFGPSNSGDRRKARQREPR